LIFIFNRNIFIVAMIYNYVNNILKKYFFFQGIYRIEIILRGSMKKSVFYQPVKFLRCFNVLHYLISIYGTLL